MEYDTKTIILNNEGPIAGDKFTENKFTVKGEQKIIFDLSNIVKETIDTTNNVATAKVDGAVTNDDDIVLDNNDGIIIPDMVVEGTGISGFVTVKEVTNQNNIKLSSNQTLSNDVDLTFTLKVLSTIYKTKADWGDGREDYYESEFNFDTLRFEPPETIEHTYSITTSADIIKGVVFFEYQNGLTSFAQLCAYCSRANLVDLQIKNLENQLFVVEDVKKLTTYVDKNNNLYNLALTPSMLTRYDSSQQDIIEIPEDERAFLQTSDIGDLENVLSATDIQAEDSPSKSAFDYTGSRFVVY